MVGALPLLPWGRCCRDAALYSFHLANVKDDCVLALNSLHEQNAAHRVTDRTVDGQDLGSENHEEIS